MRIADFDAVLLDMDGTLYRVAHAIPGAADAMARLASAGVLVACLTNNSANPPPPRAARLATMGISVPPQRIHTAAAAKADLIVRRWGRARVFNFAGEALPAELAGRAALVTGDSPCDVVAVGTHFRENAVGFNMDAALTALACLRRGASLVVGCADRVFPIPNALPGAGVEVGSGSWGALFAYAAALPPSRIHYAGKPQRVFFESLCDKLAIQPHRCLLVGDNLDSDIRGGLAVGMKTALVLTGITQPHDVDHSSVRPDIVAADLREVVRQLLAD